MVQFMTRSVDFLEYLQQIGVSKFLQFPHCVMSSKKPFHTRQILIHRLIQSLELEGSKVRLYTSAFAYKIVLHVGKNSCQKFQFLTLKKNPNRKEEKTEKNFVKLTYFPRMTNFISSVQKNENFVSLHKSFVKMT